MWLVGRITAVSQHILPLVVNVAHKSYPYEKIRYISYSISKLKGSNPEWGKKIYSKHRSFSLVTLDNMNAEEVEKQLEPFRARVKEQGDLVRKLKDDGAPEIEVKKQVLELKMRKKLLEDKSNALVKTETFDRAKMADLVRRRFYYDNSFAIYGGISGQYDYGPMGCDIVDNILAEWHRHFVIKERMSKVNCSILTPENVLKASGHVDKFADYMVKDVKSGECFRLDHLIKQNFEKVVADKKTSDEEKKKIQRHLDLIEGMSMAEMDAICKEYQMKSPISGNDLSDAVEFNLMFPISIGPSGQMKGFLRPETAQGVFVNFKRLLEYNQGRLPFACAQVGNAYRNEISPRSGILRVREFTMAEIEHFYDPADTSCDKLQKVQDTELYFYSTSRQMDGLSPIKMTIGDAMKTGMVRNETLAYYMARIQQFLVKIGISTNKLRFRQHLDNEMAHYACDCWDAECLTSYGWIECVGCADRSAYDLTQHTKATGVRLTVEKSLPEARTINVVTPIIDKRALGKTFKKDAKAVTDALVNMSPCDLDEMERNLEKIGEHKVLSFTITKDIVSGITREQKNVHSEEIIPGVIEPSFGVGRVMYAVLEHTFRVREDDDKRTLFALPTVIAPVKVCVLPLSSKQEFAPFTRQLADAMTDLDITVRVDESAGSIGRRYTKADEIAIPFGVTVDFDTVNDSAHTVTLRDRDTCLQVRMPIEEVPKTVKALSDGKITWDQVLEKWPRFEGQETTK